MKRIKIALIVAHDPKLCIGVNGKIPWYYPEDLKYFKRVTTGFPIVMGRKTFESVGSKPLPNRQNIILSTSINPGDGITIIREPVELFDLEFESEKVFIVGGSAVYEYFLPFAEELYITEIKQEFPGDTFFPDYRSQLDSKWELSSREEHDAYNFVVYHSK